MHRLLAAAALCCLLPVAAVAQDMTPDEVKRLALEAILENPEVLEEAIAILEERKEAERAAASAEAIARLAPELVDDANAPVRGNVDGDVTVVEFFDYNCPYCKQAAAEVEALLESDPGVRLVYREWPILGPGSLYAARAALASREQGRYEAFHKAMMQDRTRKDEAAVLRIARSVGIDIERLKADMESDSVREHIVRSDELAREIGFSGTPSFVIGKRGLFGAASAEELAKLVEEARAE